MTFASLASKYESSDEPESDLGLDGSRGLLRMKSSAPSWFHHGGLAVAVVLDEETGGGEPVTGFEACQLVPHDGEEEVDDVGAVVGSVLDCGCQGHVELGMVNSEFVIDRMFC